MQNNKNKMNKRDNNNHHIVSLQNNRHFCSVIDLTKVCRCYMYTGLKWDVDKIEKKNKINPFNNICIPATTQHILL